MEGKAKAEKRIFVVDDNIISVVSITNVLTRAGYKTDFAFDGKTALSGIMSKKYDLILLDISLPDIDGFDVCKRLKSNSFTKFIPIIFISAVEDDEMVYEKGFMLGAMDYLKKPITPAELIFKIKNYLRLAKTETKLRQNEVLFKSVVNDQAEFVVRYKPDGTLTFVNTAFSRYLKKPVSELIGSNFFDQLYIDKKAEIRSANLTVNMLHETDIIEISRPDGEIVWQQWTQRLITDKTNSKAVIQAIGRDISESKKREDFLKQYEYIFKHAGWGIAANQPGSLYFGQVNEAYARMHGYSVDELRGQKISIVFEEGSDYLVRGIIRKATEEGHYSYQSTHKRKDGQVFPAFTDITIMRNEDGGDSLLIANVQDITEQKEVDRAILQTIISTEEKDRIRFSQDLHDDLGPLLSTAKLYIKSFETAKDAKNKQIAIDRSIQAIDEAIISIKEIANSLSPHVLRDFGLISGIKFLINKFHEAGSLKIEFSTEIEERFEENIESSIFRIVAELINNTVKHANASKAKISITKNDKELIVIYSDDGVGFKLEEALGKKLSRGLSNIINRVNSLDGEVVFDNDIKGIKVSISVPL